MYHLYTILVKPKYNIKFVKTIHESCLKYIKIPFIHYCLTDSPDEFIGTDIIPIDIREYDLDGWWYKLLLFKPGFCKTGIECLFFDLDAKILKPIDDMIQFNDKLILAMNPTKVNYKNLVNKSIRKKLLGQYYTILNSSMMMWRGGNHAELYEKFIANSEKYLFQYYGNDEFITFEYPNGYDLIDPKWIFNRASTINSVISLKMSDEDMMKLL